MRKEEARGGELSEESGGVLVCRVSLFLNQGGEMEVSKPGPALCKGRNPSQGSERVGWGHSLSAQVRSDLEANDVATPYAAMLIL